MNHTAEELAKICQDLYAGEKSRNFMLHLIRAYVPSTKVKPVQQFTEKNKSRCAICGDRLYDTAKIVNSLIIDGAITNAEFTPHIEVDGKLVAYTGDSTDTCLCMHCANALTEFTELAMQAKDPGITRTVRDMRQKESGRPAGGERHKNNSGGIMLGEHPAFAKLKSLKF